MAISNDSEFKAALEGLDSAQQRQVGARFTERVLELSDDPRVKSAVSSAKRPDVSDVELAAMLQAARTANVESYTACGAECDWKAQAGHFVAEAAVACVTPADGRRNQAWEAAMRARMARTCEAIAAGGSTDNREPREQYRLLEEFLQP